jgi:hypothetical protein
MKMAVFWDVMPCSLVEIDRRFRGAFCLHHQGATSQKTAIFGREFIIAQFVSANLIPTL